jgi:hypothetical protein
MIFIHTHTHTQNLVPLLTALMLIVSRYCDEDDNGRKNWSFEDIVNDCTGYMRGHAVA